jgi:chorismate dehydratase
MTDSVRVSAVSYVNSYPFILGLKKHAVAEKIDLQLDTPADCAKKLLSGEVDLGLVPVAILPQLENAHIITDTCIGSDGPVESVCLFSDVPLSEIEEVLLDYQSRTSVELAKIIAEKHWYIQPKWINGTEDFIDRIGGKTAGIVIGDRAFKLKERFLVVKDLSEEWKVFTGLPFVFACWVSNRPLGADFISSFSEALELGLKNKGMAISAFAGNNEVDMLRYVDEVISYHLDDKKREAMKLFLDWSSKSS